MGKHMKRGLWLQSISVATMQGSIRSSGISRFEAGQVTFQGHLPTGQGLGTTIRQTLHQITF